MFADNSEAFEIVCNGFMNHAAQSHLRLVKVRIGVKVGIKISFGQEGLLSRL